MLEIEIETLIKTIKNPSIKLMEQAIEQDADFIAYIENPPEDIQMKALQKDRESIMYIKNPTKKVALEAFYLWYQKEDYKYGPCNAKDHLIKSLYYSRKQWFFQDLRDYKEELKHIPYFQSLSDFLFLYRGDWLKSFIEVLSPLTKEQQDIWKKYRLKTLY